MAEQLENAINGSRIPDTIKLLPNYAGDPKGLVPWLETVQETLNLYQHMAQNPIYPVWLRHVRGKILDRANDALVNAHVPLEWNLIKATLISYFGDRRDLSTLTQKIYSLKQGIKGIDDFYNEAHTLMSDINAKVMLDEENEGHEDALIRFVGNLVRDGFIDGLNEPFGSYTRNARPANLREAFQVAKEQYEASGRKRERNPGFPRVLPPPPRNSGPFSAPFVQRNFAPPAGPFRPRNSNPPFDRPPMNFQNRRPNPQNFQRPVPMEVDQSLRSRFQNRNHFNVHDGVDWAWAELYDDGICYDEYEHGVAQEVNVENVAQCSQNDVDDGVKGPTDSSNVSKVDELNFSLVSTPKTSI